MQMPMLTRLKLIFCIFSIAFIGSCTKHEGAPPLKDISNLKQTEFVLTMENDLPDNKNAIYTPTFLYAWDAVKKLFNSPIITSGSNSEDFRIMNQSRSFTNSMNKDEYDVKAYLEGNEVVSKASFNVALPFPSKLQRLDNGIIFSKEKVLAFGMNYPDDKILKFTRILFYKDDDNFIIKLIPKDAEYEIILIKGLKDVKTLADAFKQTNKLIKNGASKKKRANDSWKYEFRDEDNFAVPVIKFNIEKDYQSIEGQEFICNGIKRTIQVASQKTSMILDENGAEIESRAAVASSDSVGEPPKIHPKNMTFNKTFFILIKRTDKMNPCFLMRVTNAELMIEKK